MIYPNYYTATNIAQVYLGGLRPHYLLKPRSVVLTSYQYTMNFGDDLYSLASTIFGSNSQYQWPIIGEIQQDLKEPDDWDTGDVVNLPIVILAEQNTIIDTPLNGQSFTAVL